MFVLPASNLAEYSLRSLRHEVAILTQLPANEAIVPPSDGSLQALAQVGRGSPAGGRGEPAAVREEGSNFRLGWARTVGVMLERLPAAGEPANQLDQLRHRDRFTAAGVVRPTKLDPRRGSDREKSRRRIVHEREVAHRRRIPNHDRAAVWVESLSQDRRDHGPLALAWPEGVERPQNGDPEIERAGECFGHHVGANFGGGIGRLALERMAFGDGRRESRPVN